jgi:oligoribonuclease NrnB/cAMP/cGMP phosphodiesterase (DHH superfamily)
MNIELTAPSEIQSVLASVIREDTDRMAVLYHADCNDGLVSAAVVIKFLFSRGYDWSDIVIYPVKYDGKIPNLNFAELSGIFVVDFAFPGEVNDTLARSICNDKPVGSRPFVLTIDHHKTAVNNLLEYYGADENGEGGCVNSMALLYALSLDRGVAGANLTWRTLFPGEPEPDIVADVSDRDTWLFERENSKATYWGLQALGLHNNRTPEFIARWYLGVDAPEGHDIASQYGVCVGTGRSMMTMEELTMKHIAQQARVGHVRFYKKANGRNGPLYHVMWVNCPYMYASNTAEWIRQNHSDWTQDTVVILYSIAPDKTVNISIRTANETAREIAELGPFAGGGHGNSAGGKLTLPSLNYWLNETQDDFGEDDA